MPSKSIACAVVVMPLAVVLTASPVLAPSAAPATPPATVAQAAPAAPATAPKPSPVRDIRSKLSAGDLLSAESILEVYHAEHGDDGGFLAGLSWLARGALMLGDTDKARRYALDVRGRCSNALARGDDIAKDHDLETALGAAIEVQAQLFERADGARVAADYVRGELARIAGPEALRVRLNKRIDLLTLVGTPAPELVAEDFVGAPPPTLASLHGSPVVLFVWAQWCSDCKAQAAALARAQARYASRGLKLIALTRYYETDPADRAHEKAVVDSVWNADYRALGAVPIVISTASDERYGGSSTPTMVFIDRAGIVRRYTPTRLTDEEFDRTLLPLMK